MHIGLISCTKSKTTYPAPAHDLYWPSALFRGALGYLEGRADRIYVLSAKYGLLPLDQVAEPYNQTLKDATGEYRREWAKQVLADVQARHGQSLAGITFEFHAGSVYCLDLQPLLEAAGATCTSPVAGLPIGGRRHFYATGVRVQTQPRGPVRRTVTMYREPPTSITKLKIHAEVWLGAALLQEAGHATFTGARLAEEIERRFGDIRPGIQTHITAHCVANARKNNTTEYSYLFRSDVGEYRLYRRGDSLHPSRSGSRTMPDQADIPEQFWDVWRRYQAH